MATLLSIMAKHLSRVSHIYTKSSAWTKILFFSVVLVIIVCTFKPHENGLEGFQQMDEFLFKSEPKDIYDDFYANIYDHLVFNQIKNDYEVGEIVNSTTPSTVSKILDVGCGTGHHVAMLNSKNLDVIGIDTSPSMIKRAKTLYPNYDFSVADALVSAQFGANSFTHILCMYFTLYYFKDKQLFFNNCMKWLMPGGFLIVHMVNPDKFDPILPPGNPLMLVSPQKYAKKRITNTKVKFTDFSYDADFAMNPATHVAKFTEKIVNDKNGKVRKNEHTMYMDSIDDILNMAQSSGFILQGIADLVKCQYEYQYLYIFLKPN
jgi:SAM-dependent methyltransferase